MRNMYLKDLRPYVCSELITSCSQQRSRGLLRGVSYNTCDVITGALDGGVSKAIKNAR